MRARPPLWLQRPSRFAGLSRTRARGVLILLALLLLAAWQSLLLAGPRTGVSPAADRALYDGIVAGVRAGGGYYEVAADQLRVLEYPLRPFLAFRLPTLTVVQAALPPVVLPVLMLLLAMIAGFAWLARLMRDAVARAPALIVAAVLMAGGLVAFVQWSAWPFHELWAAPLIALSLALRRPGLWVSAAAIGLCAALIRETAGFYLMVMAVMAWIDGDRREAAGWLTAIGVLAVALACHAVGAAHAAGPLDAQAIGWAGPAGPGAFARAVAQASVLAVAPLAIGAPLVALGAFGWVGWNDPAGRRVAATIGAYALLASVLARPDAIYWALMATPLVLVGLVFLPDALRDLFAAAMDTRRVRVQRVTR